MESKSNQIKGAFLTMFGAACWGISGCTGQYLFTRQGMDAFWLAPIRLTLAGILLCGYFLVRNPKLLFAPWHGRRNIIDLLIYGIAGVSGCQMLYFTTIQLAGAGMATILQNISPVFILMVVCWQAKRMPRGFEIGSILLALVGLFFLTTHGSLDGLAVSPEALVTGLCCALCVVVYTVWPHNLQQQFPTPVLQGWAFLVGGVLFSLICRPWEVGYVPNAMGWLGIAVVVIIGNVVAFCSFMQGVKMVGAQKASLYSFAEPVTAAVISTLVLGSSFSFWDALGFGCIFLMLVLLAKPQPHPAVSAPKPAKAHT